jgi:hypothetical protein
MQRLQIPSYTNRGFSFNAAIAFLKAAVKQLFVVDEFGLALRIIY